MQDAATILTLTGMPVASAGAAMRQAGDALREVPAALIGLPWPVLAALALVPPALSLGARSGLAVVGSIVLVPLSLAALSQGDGFGLALWPYAAALLLAVDGFRDRSRRRLLESLAGEVATMHREVDGFLGALDRRARAVDLKTADVGPVRPGEASSSP